MRGLDLAGRRCPAADRRQFGLHPAAKLQRLAEPLVLDDGALVDAADLVEGAVGQRQALVADLHPPVGEVVDRDPLAGQVAGQIAGLEEEQHPVVLQSQRVGDRALDAAR